MLEQNIRLSGIVHPRVYRQRRSLVTYSWARGCRMLNFSLSHSVFPFLCQCLCPLSLSSSLSFSPPFPSALFSMLCFGSSLFDAWGLSRGTQGPWEYAAQERVTCVRADWLDAEEAEACLAPPGQQFCVVWERLDGGTVQLEQRSAQQVSLGI